MVVWLPPGRSIRFPPADSADAEGLLAVGGDLSPARLLRAYDEGIFPWFDEGLPPLWWSPDPRAVLVPGRVHVSRSLARTLRSGRFRFTCDAAFGAVIRACAEGRPEGTWITRDMIRAFERLHALGHAHSFEAWHGDELAGGLYGVHRGALFAAESMFHRVTDASKAALVHAVRTLAAAGLELIDVQMLTPHLASLGAEEWQRSQYLDAVRGLVARSGVRIVAQE